MLPRRIQLHARKILPKTIRSRAVIILTVLVAAVSMSLISTAHAASYIYANNVLTSENSFRYSGIRPSITGGRALVTNPSSEIVVPTVTAETYRSSPGYKTLGYAVGGLSVTLNHARFSSAQQKCTWMWQWSGGTVGAHRLYCSATT